MKALILTNPGLEEVSKDEIFSKIPSLAKRDVFIDTALLLHDIDSLEHLKQMCSSLYTVNRILLSQGTLGSPLFSLELIRNKTLAVRCIGFEDSVISASSCASQICTVLDKQGCSYKVNLKQPDVLIFCVKGKDQTCLGIDFSGDLTKRDYLIFIHNQALRPTIAASLVHLSEFRGKGILLDPFCGGGTVSIEAALEAKGTLHQYDAHKFPYLRLLGISEPVLTTPKQETRARIVGYDLSLHTITSARKNAKIAGVNKDIELSAVDAHMLDIKFDEKSVDFIVTHLPLLSRSTDMQKTLKLWDEFLFIARDILIKRMIVAVNVDAPFEELLSKYAFTLVEKRIIYQGESKLFVYILE